ncbi:hypothetical protein ACP8Y2_01920 [Herpetosiphon llansteffanensis]
MPVLIQLTTADHGGRVSTGKCGTAECGVSCNCGCPYTAMETRGHTEAIELIEARYPNQWLGLVIPPEEDEFAPERAMLVAYSHDDNEVWDAMSRVTHNQVVHVYFNGQYSADYADWAASEPATYGARLIQPSPFGGDMISLMPL